MGEDVREYIYQKRLPSKKYILKNYRAQMIQGEGFKVHYPGMYADFKGSIPEWDAEPEARKILLWELQTGFTREDDRDKRFKQLLKEVCSKLEKHPDFIAGEIWKRKSKQEEIEEIGVFICEHCPEQAFKTRTLLIEHKKTHESKPVNTIVEGVAHV